MRKNFTFVLITVLATTIGACGKKNKSETEGNEPNGVGGAGGAGNSGEGDICADFPGTRLTADNRFIRGAVPLNVAGRNDPSFMLHVQNLVKTDAQSWTNDQVSTFQRTGETPCVAFKNIAAMWQQYFVDLANRGISGEVIGMYLDGITDPRDEDYRANAGVYAEEFLGSCGYAGLPGTITCDVAHDESYMKYFLPHESTHGFQWERRLAGDDLDMNLFRVFSSYTNEFYFQSLSDPTQFKPSDRLWIVDPMDYAIQNEVEWQAEIFKGFLYGDQAHWAYISAKFPDLVEFFDCIWLTGQSNQDCQSSAGLPLVALPELIPTAEIRSVTGFSTPESTAIWNVCLQLADLPQTATFNQMSERLTPGLYSNRSSLYKLGYGDCNHDGYVDWVCSYQGPAPDGSSSYLWNAANKIGTYTFITSGKQGDSYAEYVQDPFREPDAVTDATLLQPMYRQWQGRFGSCNGASYFSWAPEQFGIISGAISDLPSALLNKTEW
jgi:hypothetical protein